MNICSIKLFVVWKYGIRECMCDIDIPCTYMIVMTIYRL